MSVGTTELARCPVSSDHSRLMRRDADSIKERYFGMAREEYWRKAMASVNVRYIVHDVDAISASPSLCTLRLHSRSLQKVTCASC
jgi:hypothetical protein